MEDVGTSMTHIILCVIGWQRFSSILRHQNSIVSVYKTVLALWV